MNPIMNINTDATTTTHDTDINAGTLAELGFPACVYVEGSTLALTIEPIIIIVDTKANHLHFEFGNSHSPFSKHVAVLVLAIRNPEQHILFASTIVDCFMELFMWST
jgi:hypothetical protein